MGTAWMEGEEWTGTVAWLLIGMVAEAFAWGWAGWVRGGELTLRCCQPAL